MTDPAPGQTWQSRATKRCYAVVKLRDGRLALWKHGWRKIVNPNWSKYRLVWDGEKVKQGDDI